MSTKASLQYAAVGSYYWHTQFSWHVYHECRDDTVRLTVAIFGRHVIKAVHVPSWYQRWLGVCL